MTTLSGFEDAAREALMDELEESVESRGQQLKDDAEDNFQSYASERGYDIQHVWRDAEGPDVERSRQTVTARLHWPALSALFEYGVDPHVIEGNPTLAFSWESPPEGTRPQGAPAFVETDSVNWGSVTGGIDEARAIRTALDSLRADMEG